MAARGLTVVLQTAAGTSTLFRSPIAINRWRAFDPATGTFLQPDILDQTGRLRPEGYPYARSEFVSNSDSSGLKSPTSDGPSFESNCSPDTQQLIKATMVKVMFDIMACTDGQCEWAPDTRREWIFRMFSISLIGCPGMGKENNEDSARRYGPDFSIDDYGLIAFRSRYYRAAAYTDFRNNHMLLPPQAFNPTRDPHRCLGQFIAHEALHVANYHLSFGNWNNLSHFHNVIFAARDWGDLRDGDERTIVNTVNKCVTCQ